MAGNANSGRREEGYGESPYDRDEEFEPREKKVEAPPEPPEWLSPKAREQWELLAPNLVQMNLANNIDKQMFGRYCEIFVEWIVAKNFIQEHGTTFPQYVTETEKDANGYIMRDELGNPKRHRRLKSMQVFPQAATFKTLAKELQLMEGLLGFSPKAKQKLAEVPGGEKGKLKHVDPTDRFDYPEEGDEQ